MILSERDAQPNEEAFRSTLAAILASVIAVGGAPLALPTLLLLSYAGQQIVSSRYSLIDSATTRSQMDNAYWLTVKQQLFCTMPDDGILTPQVLQAMADSLENNIPNKEQANSLLSGILRGMSRDAARYVSIFGADYDGDNNGCDDCTPNCQLIPVGVVSQVTSLGNNKWKLKVDNGLFGNVGSYRLPYTNRCCRIKIDNIVIAPTPATGTPIARTLCGENETEYFTELESLDDQCFTMLEIFSTSPWEFDITVTDDCSGFTTCQLYAQIATAMYEPLPIQPNGDYTLSSTDNLPLSTTGGFRRYYLGSSTGCCEVELAPFADGFNGQFPEKVRVYDCDGNETEYTDPEDIERFFAGEICFNSFALAPSENSFYLVKVRINECDNVGLFCRQWDFTETAGEFISGYPGYNPPYYSTWVLGEGWKPTGSPAGNNGFERTFDPILITGLHLEWHGSGGGNLAQISLQLFLAGTLLMTVTSQESGADGYMNMPAGQQYLADQIIVGGNNSIGAGTFAFTFMQVVYKAETPILGEDNCP